MNGECVNFIEIWGRKKSAPVVGGTRYWYEAEYYTYTLSSEDSSVRDERHTNELVECLIGKSGLWKAERPEPAEDFIPWFTVAIGVSETRQKVSHYTVDYHKHDGCPLNIIDFGMHIYRLIKRNIKRAINRGQAK